MSKLKETADIDNEADEQIKFNQLLLEQKRLLELIAKGKSLKECLSSLCKAVSRINPGVRASVLLADDPREKFDRSVAPDLLPSFGEGLEGASINDLAIGTCGTAVISGEPVTCKDIAGDEKWSKEWCELCLANDVLACHSKPVFDQYGEAIGSFMLCFDEAREPNKWEHKLAELGTHIVSIVLERNRSRKSLRKHKTHLKADLKDSRLLHGISTELIEEENIEILYEKILDAAMAIMDSEYATLQMLHPDRGDKGELRLLAFRGFTPDAVKSWKWMKPSSKGGTCSYVLKWEERVIVSDVEKSDFLQDTEDLTIFREVDIRAVQSTPLISRSGQVLGMISTHWEKPHQPSDRDLRLLDILARQAADIIEQKQDKKALRENEEQLKAIFQTAPECIKIVAADGTLLQINSAGLDMAEADSKSNVIGKSVYDFVAPEYREEYQAFNEKICRGESGIFQFDIIGFEGTRRHIESHAVPMQKPDGTIAQLALTRDLTERKQREERDKFLLKLNDALQPLADPDEIKKEATHVLGEHLKANRVLYAETDREHVVVEGDYSEGVSSISGRHRLEDFGPTFMDELRSGQTHIEKDIPNNLHLKPQERENYQSINTKAQIVVSLVKNDQLVAILTVHQTEPREWTDQEVRIVEQTAERTWSAVEHAKAEKQLRQSREKYHTLFNSIDEGFCIIKMIFDEDDNPVDYRYVEVNPAFEEQTGLENPVGKKVRTIIPEHEQHWFDNYGKIAKTGEPARFEQSAEGLNRFFNVYAFPFGEEDNNKVAVLFNDISERKKVEKEREELLREVENEREHLDNIFQNAPSFMCVQRGPDHVYERVNDLYRQITGDRELMGKTVREALPDLKGQGFFDLLDQVYETGKPYIGTDVKVMLQNPENEQEIEERYLDFVYQPIRNSDGEVTGIFTQGVDLTEQKQAKRELQEINETLEKRVEDRTSSLLAYQKQLRRLATRLSRTEEEERRRLATELHDNLGQLLAICKMKMDATEKTGNLSDVSEASELVDDALEYTRQLMSELKPPPSLGEEDLAANIDWLTEKIKKHDLEVTFDNKIQKSVKLDEDVQITLVQSIRELLFNVVKHANVDEAYITLSYADYQLQITVEDEGEGFDANNLNDDIAEDGGFGLFNIRERIDLLGGRVDIESAPGEGTKISMVVPLEEKKSDDQSESKKEEEEESLATESGSKIKVLLVDDHKMMREGLKKIIETESDLTVIAEASDGESAVKIAQEVQPDIILMDINLPGMSGIDATEQIKSELSETIVIGLSVYDDEKVASEMRNAGASAYLTKSDAFETLSATIRSEIKAQSS